jgi:hypothetical protein
VAFTAADTFGAMLAAYRRKETALGRALGK